MVHNHSESTYSQRGAAWYDLQWVSTTRHLERPSTRGGAVLRQVGAHNRHIRAAAHEQCAARLGMAILDAAIYEYQHRLGYKDRSMVVAGQDDLCKVHCTAGDG